MVQFYPRGSYVPLVGTVVAYYTGQVTVQGPNGIKHSGVWERDLKIVEASRTV